MPVQIVLVWLMSEKPCIAPAPCTISLCLEVDTGAIAIELKGAGLAAIDADSDHIQGDVPRVHQGSSRSMRSHMSEEHDQIRRTVIAALAGAPFLAVAGAGSSGEVFRSSGARTLVAYFSRTGNTRVIAGLIQRGLQADLFEICPQTPYPEDYLQTVEQARQERDAGFEPTLKGKVPNMVGYDVLFLGFPIWGETMPPLVRSFLSAHQLTGKTIIPFITHGGYGVGSSRSALESHAPQSKVAEGFLMEGEQERRTMEHVNKWLSDSDFTT